MTGLRWAPLAAWFVRAWIYYGCALSLLPVTWVRCNELEVVERLAAASYAKDGLRDIETFLRSQS